MLNNRSLRLIFVAAGGVRHGSTDLSSEGQIEVMQAFDRLEKLNLAPSSVAGAARLHLVTQDHANVVESARLLAFCLKKDHTNVATCPSSLAAPPQNSLTGTEIANLQSNVRKTVSSVVDPLDPVIDTVVLVLDGDQAALYASATVSFQTSHRMRYTFHPGGVAVFEGQARNLSNALERPGTLLPRDTFKVEEMAFGH